MKIDWLASMNRKGDQNETWRHEPFLSLHAAQQRIDLQNHLFINIKIIIYETRYAC
jgi:hypothetical protein